MRHLLNRTFDLKRRVDMGGWFEWELYGTIKGRMRPVSVAETTLAVVSGVAISHIFYCMADADIKEYDRIVTGLGEVEIRAIKNPSYANHHYECWGKHLAG